MTPTPEQPKILVIKLSALGDFIMCFAAFHAIRQHHPDAHITLLTTKPFVALAEKSGWFDAIEIDTRPKLVDIKKWWSLRSWLVKNNFFRVYDLQTNDRTGFYFNMMWPHRPIWSGNAKGCAFYHGGAERETLHAFDIHRVQLQIAGIADTPFADLNFMDGDITAFQLPEKFIMLVPGCAPTRPLKRWPASHYAALANLCVADGITPVLIGTKDEADVTATIKTACPAAIDLTGKTSLFDIAAIARRAHGAVGNDTGPMHLIAACGCPSLSLFSNDSLPSHSRPMGPATAFLQENNLPDLSVATVYSKVITR